MKESGEWLKCCVMNLMCFFFSSVAVLSLSLMKFLMAHTGLWLGTFMWPSGVKINSSPINLHHNNMSRVTRHLQPTRNMDNYNTTTNFCTICHHQLQSRQFVIFVWKLFRSGVIWHYHKIWGFKPLHTDSALENAIIIVHTNKVAYVTCLTAAGMRITSLALSLPGDEDL